MSESELQATLGGHTKTSYATLHKGWHRPMSKRFINPPDSILRETLMTRIVVAYPRLAFPATKRINHAPIKFDQQAQVSQGHVIMQK